MSQAPVEVEGDEANTGVSDIPQRLRTLHNLVIQYASQGQLHAI